MPELNVVLDGVTLTGYLDSGARIVCSAVTGWGSVGTDINVRQRTGADGGSAGASRRTARRIVLSGSISAATPEDADNALSVLNAACSPADVAMTVVVGDFARSTNVRRDGELVAEWLSATAITWSMQLVALDPRKTEAPVNSGPISLAVASGGLEVPFTIPFTIGSTITGGSATLVNPGNITGPLSLRFDGPLTNPTVTHTDVDGTVSTLTLSLAVASGEYVVVDPEAKTVLLGGTVSRRGYVTTVDWPTFSPGSNTYAFSAGAGAGTLTVSGTPSWL